MTDSSAPLVSIVIPCWNAEQFIGDAIESALAQDYRRIEVIVVDDGSTDRSLDVVRRFGQKIETRSVPNNGASAARNLGLSVARGEFVQFLDADDRLHERKIQRQLELMLASGAQSAYCDVEMLEEDRLGEAPVIWRHERSEDPVCLALGSNSGTPSGLHRTSTVKAIGGFDESLPCAQDRDFHLRLAIHTGSAMVVPEVLVTLIRRRNSLSADATKVYSQYPSILSGAKTLLERKAGFTRKRRSAMARLLAQGARGCARGGDWKVARELWRLAGTIDQQGLRSVYGDRGKMLVSILGPELTERFILLGRPVTKR